MCLTQYVLRKQNRKLLNLNYTIKKEKIDTMEVF